MNNFKYAIGDRVRICLNCDIKNDIVTIKNRTMGTWSNGDKCPTYNVEENNYAWKENWFSPLKEVKINSNEILSLLKG